MARLFQHMAWADRRAGDLLASLTAREVPDARRLFAHVVAAERIWLQRIRGEDSSRTPIWPEWRVDEIQAMAADNARGYLALADADGSRLVEYRNSQGTPFRTQLDDLLMHVALHGSYHRGQVALALRRAGVEPVNTDYVTFVRQG
jgi:uncharacterized damage-inducible protein DinB